MSGNSLRVWVYDDGEKINPVNGNLWHANQNIYGGPVAGDHRGQNRVWDGASRTVNLRAARNEVVAFQVVIEAGAEALSGVNVKVEGDLEATVNLFRERYVPIAGYWYADPLVPFEAPGAVPFDIPDSECGIEGQRNQAVWVDVYVPPDASPGQREAAVVVTAEGQQEVRLRLLLDVIPITLPTEVHVDCDLNTYGNFMLKMAGTEDHTSAECRAVERRYLQLAHDHRATLSITPYTQGGEVYPGFAPPLTGEGSAMRVTDWSDYDAHLGPYFDGSAFEDCLLPARPASHAYLTFNLDWPCSFKHYGTDRYREENQAVARQIVAHAKEKGWTATEFQIYYNEKPSFGHFPFEMDEPRTQQDLDALAYVSSVIRPAIADCSPARFVFRMDITEYDWLEPQLGDKIDLFNVSAGIDLTFAPWHRVWRQTSGWYNIPSIQMHQAQGARAWFYGGAGRIDFNLLVNRRYAHRAWRWRADGFCLWCADWWGSGDPWTSGELGHRGFDFIYYPGKAVGVDGPLPSLRLKALRRGLQDYEYMWLLSRKHEGGRLAADALLCDDQDTNTRSWDAALDRIVDSLLK